MILSCIIILFVELLHLTHERALIHIQTLCCFIGAAKPLHRGLEHLIFNLFQGPVERILRCFLTAIVRGRSSADIVSPLLTIYACSIIFESSRTLPGKE